MGKARVAVFIGSQGRGSNMNALIEACQRGDVPAEVVLVVAPNDTSPAVEVARNHKVEVVVIPYKDEHYTDALIHALEQHQIDWICLAGYMKLLPVEVLQKYPHHVLNIHPALLPKYGGKGMYGHFVHEAVLAAHESESGCTIHYVNERYDEGAIVLQLKCEVSDWDTPETLAARVLELEHKAYAQALKLLIEDNAH